MTQTVTVVSSTPEEPVAASTPLNGSRPLKRLLDGVPVAEPRWGPTGETVYERTYRRTKPDGSKETWLETVQRVAAGNLSLVYGPREQWSTETMKEYQELVQLMYEFKILPAGRQLWASGVKGRQYLFNCHVSGWGTKLSDHFEFAFMRLMEGGGVGANYGTKYLQPYGLPRRALVVHVVCDPAHPDYDKMKEAGVLSESFTYEWTGAFPVEDSREGWAQALVDLIDTYMTDQEVKHPDRVFDVSRVRAEGQPLRTFGGSASGPLPLAKLLRNTGKVLSNAFHRSDPDSVSCLTPLEAMFIDHEIGTCVVAGGNRRSARMSIVPWNDPYVMDFIACKADNAAHWTTNISVEVDNLFISLLQQPGDNNAKTILRAVAEGMRVNGEPGLWNSSLANVGEPNPIACTNPCGEIGLQEWENCNLGHINIDAFAPTQVGAAADIPGMLKAHKLMTRFLIRATYGDVTDVKQLEKLSANRRIGVGHFGVQGFLAKCGVAFTKAPEDRQFARILKDCYQAVREEARNYAFWLRIPEPVKVTTVAPTGSIAKLPGRTEGIHPVYARHFIRRVRFSTIIPEQREQVEKLAEQGYHTEPCLYAANTQVVEFPTEESLVNEVRAMGLDAETIVEAANEIPLERMLAFQALYQQHYADNSISFTVNFPPEDLNTDDIVDALTQFLPKLKGTTLMPDGSRVQAPYERITSAEYAAMTGPKVIADSVDENCANGACPVR
jgi:adenosylcobalamin-dependent ribonucleoside-triphosphate reductase